MFVLAGVVGHPETDHTYYGESTTWESGPNSADLFGVQFHVAYQGKPMKYCIISCIPINAVGDAVSCTVTDVVEARFKVTGPVESGGHTWTFEDGWYNPTIKNVKITKVDIQYMDGSTETISGEKLAKDLQLQVHYNHAIQLMEKGALDEAMEIFQDLGDYHDSANKLEQCKRLYYDYAVQLKVEGGRKLGDAIQIFQYLGDYRESANNLEKCKRLYYDYAVQLKVEGKGKLEDAIQIFQYLGDYRESANYLEKCKREYEVWKRESEKKWRRCSRIIWIIVLIPISLMVLAFIGGVLWQLLYYIVN